MEKSDKQLLWLDCDPGLDDTLALIMACRDPRLQLIGVSTSPGNTSLDNTTRNALDILYNCHRSDVPVIRGSNQLVKGQQSLAEHMHGSNGLGGVHIPQSKAKAIISEEPFREIFNRISKADGKVIWANTGSMTNLYLLLSKFPEIKSKLKEIVVMGGSVGKGNITPAAEFNIFFDPHAAKGVFDIKGDVPLTMIPLDLTSKMIAHEGVFKQLEGEKKPFAVSILEMLRQFKDMYYKAYGDQFPYPPVHDPTVIYYILEPSQIIAKKVKVQVDTCEVSYGRTNCYFKNSKNPNDPLETIDKIGLDIVSLDKFWELNFKLFREVFAKEIQ